MKPIWNCPAEDLLLTHGAMCPALTGKGLFVIKPSGVEYDELTPDMLVVMDLNGNQSGR